MSGTEKQKSKKASQKPKKSLVRPENILDYLAELSANDLSVLYEDPFTVMTVFRSLPPIAKQYVLRLLTLTGASITRSHILSWSAKDNPDAESYISENLSRLTKLRILCRNLPSAPLIEPFDDPVANARASDLPNPKIPEAPKEKRIITSIEDIMNSKPVKPVVKAEDEYVYSLGASFQRCLTKSLSNLTLGSDEISNEENNTLPSEVVDKYAYMQWDKLLHWLVGIAANEYMPSTEVKNRAKKMGLVFDARNGIREEDFNRLGDILQNNDTVLTPAGVNFLLKKQGNQVWETLLHYMDDLANTDMNRLEALQFIFRLSFMQVGIGQLISKLTKGQYQVLLQLHDIGLVYIQNDLFFPTSLIANLSTATKSYIPSTQRLPGAPTATMQAAATLTDPLALARNERFIIIETTLKVYAFTSSPYQIAILSLFVDLRFRLPNMVVGYITRKSIRRALSNNVSIHQVIGWFEEHAHRRMVETALGTTDATGKRVESTDYVISPNVTDQMKLWDSERQRLKGADSMLLDNFSSEEEFKYWYKFSLTEKTILYVDHEKKIIVVTPEGHRKILIAIDQAKKQAKNVEVKV